MRRSFRREIRVGSRHSFCSHPLEHLTRNTIRSSTTSCTYEGGWSPTRPTRGSSGIQRCLVDVDRSTLIRWLWGLWIGDIIIGSIQSAFLSRRCFFDALKVGSFSSDSNFKRVQRSGFPYACTISHAILLGEPLVAVIVFSPAGMPEKFGRRGIGGF